jgi:ComEC/Rec2-related protein
MVTLTKAPRLTKGGYLLYTLRVEGLLKEGEHFSSAPSKGAILRCLSNPVPWRNATSYKINDTGIFTLNFSKSGWCKIELSSVPKRSAPTTASTKVEMVTSFIGSRYNEVRAFLGSNDTTELFLGVALGQGALISEEVRDAFMLASLTHLLVLSGQQIMAIFSVVTGVVHRLFGPFMANVSMSLSFIITAIFALLVGLDPAVLRALGSLAYRSLAFLKATENYLFDELLFAVIITSLLHPQALTSPSLQLTLSALLGLYIGGHLFKYSPICRKLGTGLITTLLAQSVACLWFSTFSWIGVLYGTIFTPIFALYYVWVAFPVTLIHLLYPSKIPLEVAWSILWYLRETLLIFLQGYKPPPSLNSLEVVQNIALALGGVLLILFFDKIFRVNARLTKEKSFNF